MRTELIDIGIDLGAANTLVCVRGKGIVINEPSYVAVEKESRKPVAYGQEAKEMGGKAPSRILVIRPLIDGILSDVEIAKGLLDHIVSRVCVDQKLSSPSVIVGFKIGASEPERCALSDSATSAGAREVFLIEEPVAAAIGAGLPIQETRGSMIVDIGADTTQVVALSGGKVIASRLIHVAGDKMDKDVVQFMKNKHNLLIGDRTAERAKFEAWSTSREEGFLTLKGRSLVNGLPQAVNVTPTELGEALAGSVSIIADTIRDALDEMPSEMIIEPMESGICMVGGGSQLNGLSERVQEAVKVRVWVAEDPATCVARGLNVILEHPGVYDNLPVT